MMTRISKVCFVIH